MQKGLEIKWLKYLQQNLNADKVMENVIVEVHNNATDLNDVSN